MIAGYLWKIARMGTGKNNRKRTRPIRGMELPAPKDGEKSPFLTNDGNLKPGIAIPNAEKAIASEIQE